MEEWYKNFVAVEPKQTVGLATECMICGEAVPIDSIYAAPKICDKCKAVVMKLRKQEEKGE